MTNNTSGARTGFDKMTFQEVHQRWPITAPDNADYLFARMTEDVFDRILEGIRSHTEAWRVNGTSARLVGMGPLMRQTDYKLGLKPAREVVPAQRRAS